MTKTRSKEIKVYIHTVGFEHWKGVYDMSWIKSSEVSVTVFPSNCDCDMPSIRLYHRPYHIDGDFTQYAFIDFGGNKCVFRVFFPECIDSFHFLKEYIPLFKDITQMELDSIKLRNFYEVYKKK